MTLKRHCKLVALLVYLIVWHTKETYHVTCDHINPFTNKAFVHCPNPKAHIRETLVEHFRAAFSPEEANHFTGCLEKRHLRVTHTFETSEEIFDHSVNRFFHASDYPQKTEFQGVYSLKTGELIDPYEVSYQRVPGQFVASYANIYGPVTMQREGDPDPCDIP